MKKLSLQWRLTLITALLIAVISGAITLYVYGNGVYYMDSLLNVVNAQSGSDEESAEDILIRIPDDNWQEFADSFSVHLISSKADFRARSLIFSAVAALLGGIFTYFISGRALKPLNDFSEKIEAVSAQNLANSRIEETGIKEINRLVIEYNQMLERLNDAFEIQKQFTANAAHELRTPLSVMQLKLDVYNSKTQADSENSVDETIKMLSEQCEQLNKTVKTLLDMSELRSVARDDTIELKSLIEEVIADLDPLAGEKNISVSSDCEDIIFTGSDILIYRMIYNLTENALKYNNPNGTVKIMSKAEDKRVIITVADSGNGIPEKMKDRVFEPFFRVDKSRSRSLGGVGLGLSLVREIVRVHGGSISVNDNMPNGTVFVVSLPIIDKHPKEATEP